MKRLLLSFALMMIFVLPNARADNSDFTVYAEGPFSTAFSINEETFNTTATGQTYGLMIPFGSGDSFRPAIDLAYSKISLKDFYFKSATTKRKEFSSVHNPERAYFEIIEVGIRSYPSPLGFSLIYARGDWKDKNSKTGLTEKNNIDSLGLKVGVNLSVERLMFLLNVRTIFHPLISLWSAGLGWSF